MPRFDFQSGGALASANIQDFLAKRNAEQRQAMLDQLTKQDTEHKWDYQDDQTELARLAEARLKGTATLGNMETLRGALSDEADISGLPPELIKHLRATGNVKGQAAVTPKVSTSASLAPPEGADLEEWARTIESQPIEAGPQLPAREVYAGSKEFQTEKRHQGYIDELLAGRPDLVQKNPDLLQALQVARTGAQVPASVLAPAPSVVHMGPTGKLGTAQSIPRGAQVVETGFAPQTNASNRPQFVGMSGGQPVVMDPDGQFRVAPLPTGADPLQAKPSNARPSDIVPQQAWDRLRAARMAQTGGALRQAGVDQATANIKSIALSRGVTPQVMADVDDLIRVVQEDEAAGRPPKNVEQLLALVEGAEPAEMAQITSLLYGFLGEGN